MIQTRAEAVALLRRRIQESGLSTGRFARAVLTRDPRTVRKWVADDSPIPEVVLNKLENPTVPPWPPPALADVPEFDRERFAEEVSGEIVAQLRGRMQDSGICDVCGGDVS